VSKSLIVLLDLPCLLGYASGMRSPAGPLAAHPEPAHKDRAVQSSKIGSGRPLGLSVKALIGNPSGRYLLIRRSAESKHYPLKWDLPGGKVDPGEWYDIALLREITEETGLNATIIRYLGGVEFELSKVKVICLVFQATTRNARPRLSSEHTEYRWVSIEELPPLLADTFDPLVPLLRSLQRLNSRRVP
jgi:8-oxo-dGTP diphosphatase